MSEESREDVINDQISEFIREFNVASDRAAVLVGAAALDNLLSSILEHALRPSTSRDDELLEGDSPLATFSAKIALCHRLGLYGDRMYRALQMVRKIRNEFAHSIACQLDSGSIRDRVGSLAQLIREKSRSELDTHEGQVAMTGMGATSRVCRACIIFLYVKLLIGRQYVARTKQWKTDWMPISGEQAALYLE